jgi:hypothetical protein
VAKDDILFFGSAIGSPIVQILRKIHGGYMPAKNKAFFADNRKYYELEKELLMRMNSLTTAGWIDASRATNY